MTARVLTLGLFAALTLVGAGAASAAAEDEFIYDLAIRNLTEKLVISFHSDKDTMVACTEAQRAAIGARGIERLTTMSKALAARSVGRGDPPGTTLTVELDAACYEGGFMGLAGLARGAEKIQFSYEEALLGGEWGPPTDQPVQ